MKKPLFSKDNYLYKLEYSPAITPEENIILNQIESIQKNDKRLEELYYLVLWDLFLIGEKEDESYKERLKLAKLLKFLYNNEGGILLDSINQINSAIEIERKQIVELQEIIKKQLSATFLLVRLNKDSEFHFPYKTWGFENVSKWEPEERVIEVIETTTFAIEYMKQDKPVKITIDKENLDLIISMEMAREIWENTTYTGRFLNFINKYARKYGYFNCENKAISISDALFLYEILELLGFVKANFCKDIQEKYRYISNELGKSLSE